MNVMAVLMALFILMTFAAIMDGNLIGVTAFACMSATCAYLAWESRVVVKTKPESWAKTTKEVKR